MDMETKATREQNFLERMESMAGELQRIASQSEALRNCLLGESPEGERKRSHFPSGAGVYGSIEVLIYTLEAEASRIDSALGDIRSKTPNPNHRNNDTSGGIIGYSGLEWSVG